MKKLSVKQLNFAEAILSGQSVTAAAAAAGTSATSAHKWLKGETGTFIQESRKEVFESGLNKLEANLTQAVDTLSKLMAADNPPSQRLGAAKTVLEQTIKLFELRDIEKRITALEQAQATSKG